MTEHRADTALREAGDEERLETAELLARQLDRPMGILGIIFLFVVFGQLLATQPGMSRALIITGWVFWAIFVGEFVLRAYVARFRKQFWKKNWWQIIFLPVPFLRFFRALQALRLVRLARFVRLGGIVSAAIRGSRAASVG